MTNKSTYTKWPTPVLEYVQFGIKDGRGREIGARLATLTMEFVPVADNAVSWFNLAPGTYFVAVCQATRNGVCYGASQKNQYFKTEIERFVYIQKYLKDARKRALAR